MKMANQKIKDGAESDLSKQFLINFLNKKT